MCLVFQYNLLQTPAQEPSGEQQTPSTTSNNNTVSSSNGEAAAAATTGQDTTAPAAAAAPVTTALIVAPAPVVASVLTPAAAPMPSPATAPIASIATTEQAQPQVTVDQALTAARGFPAAAAGAIDPASNKYFDPQHEQEYGVEIVERDPVTQVAVAVQCLFCVHMGRDPAPETSKRQRSQRVWVWKKFGAKNYRRHHERMHAELWPLYESSSVADKAAFFTVYKDYQPGTLPPVVRPNVTRAPVSTAAPSAAAILMQKMVVVGGGGAGMVMPPAMMPHMMHGGVGAPSAGQMMMAPGGVPMKRPRGRPRKNGIAAIQWTEAMVERLVMLRYVLYLFPICFYCCH